MTFLLQATVSILRVTGKRRSAVEVAQERVDRFPRDLQGLLVLALVQGELRVADNFQNDTVIWVFPVGALPGGE
jgi:hypothetical protein